MLRKRQSSGSALKFLMTHQMLMKRYLRRFYEREDWPIIKNFFFENIIQAKVILEDFRKSNDQKLSQVIRMFIAGGSKIVFIVGARDSGKTATAFMLSEETHLMTNRPIYYVSPYVDAKILPSWMKKVDRIDQVPKGSFMMVDESAIQFNARDSMNDASKELGKQLAIARHQGKFVIFITQHVAMADINIDRLKDLTIWKRSNDYTFGVRGSTQTRAGKFWDKVRSKMAPRDQNECLFEYPAMRGFTFFKHDLPKCWSDELSKSWADYQRTIEKEKEVKKPQVKILKI